MILQKEEKEKTMKMKLTTLILTICSLVLCGCGLWGNKGVTNEQINNDIANKSVKVKDGPDWYFGSNSERCFAVNDDESKITTSNADLSVTVSSWRQSELKESPVYFTVFGKMMLHYKNEGGKWVLESIESIDLTRKSIAQEEFPKFLDIVMPQCKYFRNASLSK